jgi:signal transduction histidine kinase
LAPGEKALADTIALAPSEAAAGTLAPAYRLAARLAPPDRLVRGRARRRTVAERLLGTYFLVLVAFAITLGWSLRAFQAATRDAELLRAGYAPLIVLIGNELAQQDVLLTQLNHITAAKNPSDARDWIETKLQNRSLSRIRSAVEHLSGDAGVERLRDWAIGEVVAIESSLQDEPEGVAKLLRSLAAGDGDQAEEARADLVRREGDVAHRLHEMSKGVDQAMKDLKLAARQREERSNLYLVVLALFTLLVGVLTSLYARRVLAPLTAVTARANAVAGGDLTPHSAVDTNDEIGELATTFESMVGALQRARAEVVQAERLATIGKMAAHVTHEIRNPLSAIGLNLELLEEEVAGSAEKESMALVRAIKTEVERLAQLSEQYLSVARRPHPTLERERVDDLVQELSTFVRPQLTHAGVDLRVAIQPDLPEVDLDEALLRQSLLNLVRNAQEAMPEGGEIAIAVARAPDEPMVEIRIDDTGTGIPEELRAAIFDPFFTTKRSGTGLGLAVTLEIIEAHHGRILCEPRREGGTRFRVLLPLPAPT